MCWRWVGRNGRVGAGLPHRHMPVGGCEILGFGVGAGVCGGMRRIDGVRVFLSAWVALR